MTTGEDVQQLMLSRGRKSESDILEMCRSSGSLLFTGGALVRNDYATLVVGPGTDNILEATYEFPEQFEGIIGNGRAVIFDTREKMLYSVHSDWEMKRYYCESINKRKHNLIKSAKSDGSAIIMNLKPSEKTKFEFADRNEIGEQIVINMPSKRRKRIRNFASKAAHVRGLDICLSWKETMPMTFDEIYYGMKDLDMSYTTVVTPYYLGAAYNYVFLSPKHKNVNPQAPVLEKIVKELM